MNVYILDTNFFFNMEIKSGFGKNAKEIITNFTALAKEVKGAKKAEFYMPPRIVDEFLTFVTKDDRYVQEFLTVVTIKSPSINHIQFPAAVFYQLVDEIRDRSYKGLRIAEESVDAAGKKMHGATNLSHIDYQKTIGEIVTKLRERYRQATRFNFLDSVADLDCITLACELDGTVVSSDEGVLRWGRLFGVKEMPADLLRSHLLSIAHG